MVHYEVISCAELGGALVREGRSLTSRQISRLGLGAVVSEEELAGERVRFKKVTGTGPTSGWVSTKLLRKCEQPKEAAPKPYKGTSLLVQAETTVLEKGPAAALQEASSKGKDGNLLAAMAHLASGNPKAALESAEAAQESLKGKKEDEASATLAVALAKLAGGNASEALGLANTALGLFKEVGDKQMEASVLTTIANARLGMKEINPASTAVQEALKIFREIGDAEGEQAAQLTFSDICVAKEGKQNGLATVAKERAEYFKSKGDKIGEGRALQKLAEQQLTGLAAGADMAKLSDEAINLFRQAGDKKLELAAMHTAAVAQLVGAADAKAAEEALKVSQAIGDEAGLVDILFTLSSAYLAAGQNPKALQNAAQARQLAQKLGDKCGEARASQAAAAATLAMGGKPEEAFKLAKGAVDMFRAAGDTRGEASALQTAARATGTSEAASLLRRAATLCAASGDEAAEALAQLRLADALLLCEGGSMVEAFKSRREAGNAAERARALFLVQGDKANQARASHTAAQSKILLGDNDGGVEAAMQAVVLARSDGDKWLEAISLRTAMSGQVSKGSHAEAYRMAKEVKVLFNKLGTKNMEDAIGSFLVQLEDVLPKIHPIPRRTIAPLDNNMNLSGHSVFTQQTNCIVWTLPVTQQAYLLYCLELLKFADDLKSIPEKVSFLVVTRGVMARHLGETAASSIEGVYGTTVFAICRTIRLESPKLQIGVVDVPSCCTVHEMTECIRAARIDPGPRNEISFIIDRANQLGKRPY
eukprot:TRINITY_DN41588_c0_g1_i1.p1 TRINITY_DN41588_c0_g1~~TRINITY_DN41588_c0_g1_i1.p1  ORF type:complete len:765 (-),score=212.49 TRINITY_DN41588_c0_g1_i1:266-2560(-)